MNCPQCGGPMEPGALELKARGIGVAPQALLHFDGELVLADQYVPVVGLFRRGTRTEAHRCRACRLVCFQYEEHRG